MDDGITCTTSPCTDEKPCFAHKLKYWREEKGLQMGFSYGRADFHGPTVRERAKQQIEDARRAGIEPEYKGRAVLR